MDSGTLLIHFHWKSFQDPKNTSAASFRELCCVIGTWDGLLTAHCGVSVKSVTPLIWCPSSDEAEEGLRFCSHLNILHICGKFQGLTL